MQLNFAVRRSLLDEIDSGHIGTKMSVLIRGMYSFQGLIYNVKVCILKCPKHRGAFISVV